MFISVDHSNKKTRITLILSFFPFKFFFHFLEQCKITLEIQRKRKEEEEEEKKREFCLLVKLFIFD
jgi:hypothetical protein